MPTRVAAIGLGALEAIGSRLLSGMDDVRVVAGSDPTGPARGSFEADHAVPTYADYEPMLDEHALDAVSVVTPHTLHAEQVTACLERGLHVHVEKPMTTDLGDAATLCALAAREDLVLQVGYQRHFDPRFREMKRVIDSGRIGEPHMAACHLEQDWLSVADGTWRVDPTLSGGGQLYDSGSHLLDALLWTTGTTPRAVAAITDSRGEAVDIDSALALTLGREDGTMTASVGVTGDGPTGPDTGEGLSVWGSEGAVEFDGERIAVTEGDVTYGTEITDGTDFETVTRRKLEAFVAAVRGEREPAVPGEFGLRVVALTEAASEAAEGGRTVDVGERIERAMDRIP
ncbi:Gfo/Idh/MocA family protein [Natronorarus salvus]|uniref:Gfo/Idh/MocA family protein n=1 Tax=Natronorarus salvus TaxID=3117733 RepID=UPI002F26694C